MRVIVSISSDIGTALARDWLNEGYNVWGTYRRWSDNCNSLKKLGADLVHCDLNDQNSITAAFNSFPKEKNWSTLVLAAGDQNPIGLFKDIDFQDWAKSIQSNFVGQVDLLHKLMQIPFHENILRSVIFFAGGGTNNATERYSGYTISKIASIKLCELLDFENSCYKFTCVGPGWVESKIHDATIAAGTKAGKNLEKTILMRQDSLMNPVSNVVICCNWIIRSPKEVVGGRNFSVIHDSWENENLDEALRGNPDLYKLRRFGNEIEF